MDDRQLVEDPFLAFSPDRIPQWLTDDSGEHVDQRTIEAVVLFCDISGFTTLTNRMVNLGNEGLDQLRFTINTAFDHWIRSIRDAGGSIAMFIGDALVAVWNPEEWSGSDEAMRLATECAEVIIEDAATEHDVEVTCGVGAGPVELAILRSGQRNRSVVCHGPALDAAVEACDSDEAGAQVLDLRRDGEIDAATGNRIDVDVTDWAPHGVRERLLAGQFDWLGELRTVSVMFVGLPEAHDAAMFHQQLAVVMDVLGDRTDLLIQPNIDDKGATVLICLGAPVAHDDGPAKALRIALAIEDRLTEDGITHSIGLSTGRGYCGAVGNRDRRAYTIMGDVANVASRLMSQRRGLLVDEATVRESGGALEFENAQAYTLKGLPKPITAGRAVGAKTVVVHRTRLAGRAKEVEAIRRWAAGDGAELVLIQGEPGLGKTALAGFAAQAAVDAGKVPIVGTATAMDIDRPYSVLRSAFASSFPPGSMAAAAATIRESGADEEELASLLAAVSDEVEPTGAFDHLSGAVRAQNTRRTIAMGLDLLLDGRSGLLILEDAHRFDSATWAMVEDLHALSRVGLLLTVRPGEGHEAEIERIALRSGTEVLNLGPLNPTDLDELIRLRLDVDTVPGALRAQLADGGAGNPLFAEQFVLGMLDAGHLRKDGRTLVAPDGFGQAVSVPPTVESLLTSRIDRCTAGAQFTLKVASVIGRRYELPMLSGVHPLGPRSMIDEDTDELSDRALVRSASPQPFDIYEFGQSVTRDVAYELLPPDQQRSLHRGIADWCETEGTRAGAAVKAHHHLRGQNWEQAAQYLEAAGEEAAAEYSSAETAAAFDQLVELADDGHIESDDRIARWLRLAGDGWLGLGEYERARDRYSRALEVLDAPFPSSGGGQLAVAVRHMPRVLSGRPVAQSAEPERAKEIAWILELVSQIAYFDQDLPAMLYCAVESVRWAERSGDPRLVSRTRGAWSVVARVSRFDRSSEASGDRSRLAAEEDGSIETIAYAHLLKAVSHFPIAAWDEAEEACLLAGRLYRDIGASSDADLAYGAWSLSELFQGRTDRARTLLDKLSPTPNRQIRVWRASWTIVADLLDDVASDPAIVRDLFELVSAGNLEKGDAIVGWGAVALASADDQPQLVHAHRQLDTLVRGMPASSTGYSCFGLFAAIATAPLVPGSDALARRADAHLRVTGFQSPSIAPLAHLAASLRARTPIGRRLHRQRARARAADMSIGLLDGFERYASQHARPRKDTP